MVTRHLFIVIGVALVALVCGEPRIGSAGDAVGSLVVESDPAGASVYVDGRLAGETPLTLPEIAAGVHRVRVMRLGYLENSRLVTVKSGTRATLRARLTDPAPQTAPAAALKIVVVEGEGAVNIIQQKTAVAPVIEVRDRNDQPVSGALVRFAISKGRATFNGARTLTATTDALGRATATGLAPTGSGPLQIAASAAFQGQTVAVTIAQTTVATAAEASSVAAGTSAATGGGGLSHAALVGILGGAGAGVAGVALASKGASSQPAGPPSVYTLRTVNGAALPVVLFPECQLGGPPPCAVCIHAAASGTLTLTNGPENYSITVVTGTTCVDPQGVSPTSRGTLTNSDSGTWSAQADGTITFRSNSGLLPLRSGTQSGSTLTVVVDWLSNNPGTPALPVTTQWGK